MIPFFPIQIKIIKKHLHNLLFKEFLKVLIISL